MSDNKDLAMQLSIVLGLHEGPSAMEEIMQAFARMGTDSTLAREHLRHAAERVGTVQALVRRYMEEAG